MGMGKTDYIIVQYGKAKTTCPIDTNGSNLSTTNIGLSAIGATDVIHIHAVIRCKSRTAGTNVSVSIGVDDGTFKSIDYSLTPSSAGEMFNIEGYFSANYLVGIDGVSSATAISMNAITAARVTMQVTDGTRITETLQAFAVEVFKAG